MERTSSEYEKGSTHSLLADEQGYGECHHRKEQSRRWHISDLLHWMMHALTILLMVGLYFRTGSVFNSKDVEIYTPSRAALGDDRHVQKFKASFWQKSPYKGLFKHAEEAQSCPPTADVISHWHHLTHTPALNLTKEEVQKMGISTDSVQFPSENGGGYLAYLESAHQLHCLEALWEDHHYRKYPEMFPILKQKLDELPDIMEHHLEHCVDVLRQQLMCSAEPGVVTFRWVEGVSGPYPDFNSKHVCHDYEGLLDWAETRKADQELMDEYDWKPPESGVVKLKKAP